MFPPKGGGYPLKWVSIPKCPQAVSDEIPFELFWPMVKDDIASSPGHLLPLGQHRLLDWAIWDSNSEILPP